MKESFVKFYEYGLHTLKYTWTIHLWEKKYFVEERKKYKLLKRDKYGWLNTKLLWMENSCFDLTIEQKS